MTAIWKRVQTYRQRHPLGYRLILYTLLFSSIITLISTIIQLTLDYRHDVSAIHSRLDTIQQSHLYGVINSVWNMDDKQVETLLEGIRQLPDIEHLEIKNYRGKTIAVAGQVPQWGIITVTYPLEYTNLHKKRIDLGILAVSASLQGVYDRLKNKIIVILVSQGVKTFLVSGFIFLLFQYLVTRHLETLSKYANKTNLDQLDQPLRLERKLGKGVHEDELDRVVDSVNNMYLRMRKDRETLNNTKEQYRSLVENIGSVFFLYSHDTTGVFTYVSPSLTTILGYSSEEFLTDFDKYFTNSPINDEVLRHTELSISGQQQPRYQVEVFAKNGNVHLFEVLESPRFDNNGKVISVDGIAQDITDRSKIEKEENAKKVAEAANRTKGEFLATMSHEIRTPLTGIIGMLQQINEKDLSDSNRQKLDLMHSSSIHLRTVINHILDFSKIESGKMSLASYDFSVIDLVQEMVETSKSTAEQKGISLEVHINSSIPEWVRGDDGKLRQVLFNLMSNAMKFTQEGSVTMRVNRVVESSGQDVQLSFFVEDTGIGIPEEKLSNLFDAFSQVDSTLSRSFDGTGLGLA
jgi:PAS domain S-box-containing protein